MEYCRGYYLSNFKINKNMKNYINAYYDDYLVIETDFFNIDYVTDYITSTTEIINGSEYVQINPNYISNNKKIFFKTENSDIKIPYYVYQNSKHYIISKPNNPNLENKLYLYLYHNDTFFDLIVTGTGGLGVLPFLVTNIIPSHNSTDIEHDTIITITMNREFNESELLDSVMYLET